MDAPRSFLVHPDLFGRQGTPAWTHPSTVDQYVGLRAAEVQHQVSIIVTRLARSDRHSVGSIESDSGMARGRLSKLLRGYSRMSLRDLVAVEGVIGPILVGLPDFPRTIIKSDELLRRFPHDSALASGR